ncbi:MAG: SDR family oxidoreductase [Ignavibacteria bacterium]|jgi:3-oxoacyl-[acyl-carrier protein] reductase|nr:SDR family oxidoreductase [Ignavibacteria bacterium]MCU7503945.1 SDR family oxidoreductase [Ignavibacteria bacterium]MCU7515834.1 SDR family oxidoreductase [Ignavibacteria bacterium]
MEKKEPVVWVTGASSGIGKAAAIEFAREGFQVAASSRHESRLRLLEKEQGSESLILHLIACDVSSPSSVEEALSKIISRTGLEVSCLINNAGVTSFNSAEEDSVGEIKNIIETNLLGSIYAIKAVLPGMIKRKEGTIINVLSTAAVEVLKGSSAYSASKAGLRAYSDVLREEVRKYNIKVIDILPGPTRTPMWPEEMLNKFDSNMMAPEEIARLMVSLYRNSGSLVLEKVIMKPIGGSI